MPSFFFGTLGSLAADLSRQRPTIQPLTWEPDPLEDIDAVLGQAGLPTRPPRRMGSWFESVLADIEPEPVAPPRQSAARPAQPTTTARATAAALRDPLLDDIDAALGIVPAPLSSAGTKRTRLSSGDPLLDEIDDLLTTPTRPAPMVASGYTDPGSSRVIEPVPGPQFSAITDSAEMTRPGRSLVRQGDVSLTTPAAPLASRPAQSIPVTPKPVAPQSANREFYDYEAARRAGVVGPDASGHWPSEFKLPGHPNEVVGGFNTRTGERVPGAPRAKSVEELVALGWERRAAEELMKVPEPASPLSKATGIGPAPSRTVLGTVADVGITALKGAISIPEAALGLVDLVLSAAVPAPLRAVPGYKQPSVGKIAAEHGFDTQLSRNILERFYSSAQKRANLSVKEADGVIGTAVAALQNPSVIGHTTVESLPLMLAGGVIGRGVAAAGASRAAAGAIGEGFASGGSSAEQIRQQTPGGTLTGTQAAVAGASGAATTFFGMFGAKLAERLGIVDVDTLLAAAAKDRKAATSLASLVRTIPAGAVQEGLFEEFPQSVQEQIAQNVATGKPWHEGVAQSAVLGAFAGAVMGGGAQLLNAGRDPLLDQIDDVLGTPPAVQATPPSPPAAARPGVAEGPAPVPPAPAPQPVVPPAASVYPAPDFVPVGEEVPSTVRAAAPEWTAADEAEYERLKAERIRMAESFQQTSPAAQEARQDEARRAQAQDPLVAEIDAALGVAPAAATLEQGARVSYKGQPATIVDVASGASGGRGVRIRVDGAEEGETRVVNADILGSLADVEPTAVYAFEQPDFEGGPSIPMYTIRGGPSDGSTVMAGTLRKMGIAIPEKPEDSAETKAAKQDLKEVLRTKTPTEGAALLEANDEYEKARAGGDPAQVPGNEPAPWRRAVEFKETWGGWKAKTETVTPTPEWLASQGFVSREKVESIKREFDDLKGEIPQIVRTPDGVLILDGHHRLAAAMELGKPIKVKVYEKPAEETALAPQLALKIGDSTDVRAVSDLEAAARLVEQIRDEYENQTSEGVSGFPQMTVVDVRTGEPVARISYNGRIWDVKDEKRELQERPDGRGYGKPKPIEAKPAGKTLEEVSDEELTAAIAQGLAEEEAEEAAAKPEPPKSRPAVSQPASEKEEPPQATWMNEGEIEEAVERFKSHPVLGPAARFLEAFKDQVNQHSDGWPYWKQPSHAAGKLMGLLNAHLRAGMGAYPQRSEPTAADVEATLAPIRAFMTRRGNKAGITLPGFALPKEKAAPTSRPATSQPVTRKETPRATQEGQQPEGRQSEHSRTEGERTPAEAGRGNRAGERQAAPEPKPEEVAPAGWTTQKPEGVQKVNLPFRGPAEKPKPGSIGAIPTERGWVGSVNGPDLTHYYSAEPFEHVEEAYAAAAQLILEQRWPAQDQYGNTLDPVRDAEKWDDRLDKTLANGVPAVDLSDEDLARRAEKAVGPWRISAREERQRREKAREDLKPKPPASRPAASQPTPAGSTEKLPINRDERWKALRLRAQELGTDISRLDTIEQAAQHIADAGAMAMKSDGTVFEVGDKVRVADGDATVYTIKGIHPNGIRIESEPGKGRAVSPANIHRLVAESPVSRPAESQPGPTVIPGLRQVAISRGAAADQFEKGDRVRYGQMTATVVGRERDDLRISPDTIGSDMFVDARKVELLPKAEAPASRPGLTGQKPASKAERERLIAELKALQQQSDKPQYSRPGRQRFKLDVNIPQLINTLGAQMYSKPLMEVATKELVQNAFDAVRQAGASTKRPGRIRVDVDTTARTLTVRDDGVGMTPEILQSAFFTIGGTYKEGRPQDTSGGLGLAKMAFLLGSDKVRVETTRDGVTATTEATSAQIRNSEIDVDIARTGEPSGTIVTVWIPKTYKDANGDSLPIYMTSEPGFLREPLVGPVEITLNGKPVKSGITLEHFRKQNEFVFDWGTVHLYVDPRHQKYPEVNVLSAGLYQFRHFPFRGEATLPYHLLLDVRPKVRTDNAAYPFNNQREGFRSTIAEDIQAMNVFLNRMATEQSLLEAKESFKTIRKLPTIDIDEQWTDADLEAFERRISARTRTPRIEIPKEVESVRFTSKTVTITYADDSQDEIPREEYVKRSFRPERDVDLEKTALDVGGMNPAEPLFHDNTNAAVDEIQDALPFFAELGNTIVSFMREWGEKVGGEYGELVDTSPSGWFGGISIDRSYRGLNMVKPFQAIWINPSMLSDDAMETPEGAASEVLHLMLHEITHVSARNEGAGFTSELADNYGRLRSKEIRVEFYEETLARILRTRWAALQAINERVNHFDTKNRAESFRSASAAGPGRRPPQGPPPGASNLDADRVSPIQEQGPGGDRRTDQANQGPVGEILAGKAPAGPVDPKRLGLMVRILRTYLADGVTAFPDAARAFQQDYGTGARALDRAFELAWQVVGFMREGQTLPQAIGSAKAQRDQRLKVADVLASEAAGEAYTTDEEPGAQPEGATDEDRPVAGGEAGESRPDRRGSGRGARPRGEAGAESRPEGGTQPRPGARTRPSGTLPGPDGDAALTPQLYTITDADAIGTGSPRDRVARNLAAIRVVKQLAEEKRPATPEEQRILVRYVGWGGLPRIFEPWKYGEESTDNEYWKAQHDALTDLLTDEEYRRARNSTQNAHYTSATVIRAMWNAVQRLGVTSGSALETSAGVGHFVGLMPAELRAALSWALVEKDPMTAQIAAALYPSAFTQATGLEQAQLPGDHFTLAISNVPFGAIPITDPAFQGPAFIRRRIHNYFFAKALDKVAPGGLVAFITTRGTLDSRQNQQVREYLATRADFLGAIRLPYTAFKATAGTEVVTDIIFLRKRHEGAAPAHVAPWTDVRAVPLPNKEGAAVEQHVNEYMLDHPEMVLGTHTSTGKMRREDAYNVVPHGKTAGEHQADWNARGARQLADAVANLPANAIDLTPPATTLTAFQDALPPVGTRPFEYLVHEGRLAQIMDGKVTPVEMTAADEARIRSMLPVRAALRDVYDRMAADASDEDVKAAQRALTKTYDAFVKKHGYISDEKNWRAFHEDPDLPLLLSLEDYDDELEKATKTAIFTTRTMHAEREARTADTPEQALHLVLGERGRIDLDRAGELLGVTPEVAGDRLRAAGLIIDTPSGWQLPAQYLSGNVRLKFVEAEAAAKLDPRYQVAADLLKAVIPEDIPAHKINVRMGASWVPVDVMTQFVKHVVNVAAERDINWKLTYSPFDAKWNIEGGPREHHSQYQTSDVDTKTLLLAALNDRRITIRTPATKDVPSRVDAEATALARQRREDLHRDFVEWLFNTDPERREWAVRTYNDRFNAYVEPKVDGTYLQFRGMAQYWRDRIREHQRNSVARVLQFGNTLFAHVVGAGKTLAMAAAGMELRRMGLARKPLYVVPNHLIAQWPSEFLQYYPNAKILIARPEDLEKENRRRFTARIASGDWDAVIMPYSAFVRVSMSVEAESTYHREMLDEIETAIIEAYQAEAAETSGNVTRGGRRGRGSGRTPPHIKQLENMRDRIQAKLDKLANRPKDDMLSFEQLGVDALLVDEAHSFKNLYFHTRQQAAGIPSDNDAQRATDLYLKVRHINRLTNYRNVVLATGTPVSNSMAEIYVMQKLLQEQVLKQAGIDSFDAWLAQFGHITIEMELDPSGTGLSARARLAHFRNLGRLAELFRQVADVKTIDDLPELKAARPKLKGDAVEVISVPSTEEQLAFLGALKDRAEHLDPRARWLDNMAKITVDGRMSALDMRLIDRRTPDNPGSKLHRVAQEVASVYHEWKAKKGVQLVFMDSGTPGAEARSAADRDVWDPNLGQRVRRQPTVAERNRGMDLFADLRKKLVKLGIPSAQIATIHDIDDVPPKKRDAARKALFRKVREGQIRVLIGTSGKMGTGMNVQDRLVVEHNIDPTYKPSETEQRVGRILRQGNLFFADDPRFRVRVINYVTTGAGQQFGFDAYMWQLNEAKAKYIADFFKGDVSDAETGLDLDQTVLTASEMKAVATGNPLILELSKVQAERDRLELVRRGFEEQQREARWRLGAAQDSVARTRANLERLERTTAGLLPRGDRPTATIGGEDAVGLKDIGKALIAAAKPHTRETSASPAFFRNYDDPVSLGTMRGFTLWLTGTKEGQPVVTARHPEDTPREYYGFKEDGEFAAPITSAPLLTTSSSDDAPGGLTWGDPEFIGREINRSLNAFENRLDDQRGDLKDYEARVARHHAILDQPFPSQAEYNRAVARLEDIQRRLGVGQEQEREPEPIADDDIAEEGGGEGEASGMPDEPEDPIRGDAYGARATYRRPMAETPVGNVEGKAVSAPQIIVALGDVTEAAGKRITQRIGRVHGHRVGTWNTHTHVIRTKAANDIPTAAHEVAHALQTLLMVERRGGPWVRPQATLPMQRELVALGRALYGTRRPVGGYKGEGWAEFVRTWVTESDLQGRTSDLSRTAPEMLRWFEGAFSRDYPDVRKALDQARDLTRRWRMQGARARAEVSVVDAGSLAARVRTAVGVARQMFSMEKFVEMAQPLYELAREAETTMGRPLEPAEDPFFTLSALRTTHDARATYMVETAMIDIAGNRVGPALAEIRTLVSGKREEFTLYLWARRAVALLTDPLGPRNPGLSLADAEQIIHELDSPAFQLAAAKVYEWNASVLDYAAQASPTFARVVAAVRKRDPGDYVPLQREFDELDSLWARSMRSRGPGGGSPVKRLMGSGRRVKDMFPVMIAQASHTIRQAHTRLVIDQIIKLAGLPGMGHLIEEVPRDQRPVATATIEELIDKINREMMLRDPSASLTVDADSDVLSAAVTFFAPLERPKGKDPIIPIEDKGEVRWFHVDGKLFDTLSSLDIYRLPDVAGLPIAEWLLGKPAAAFRAGTTGLRASFGLIWNPLKDVQTMAVNTRSRRNAGVIFGHWLRGMVEMGLSRASVHSGAWVDAWLRLGGEMAQPLGQDIPHTRRAARRLFEGRVVRTLDPRNWFDFYRDLIQFPEGAPRVAELRLVAEEIGWQPGQPMTLDQSLQLLLASKQVTTDFTAAGEVARVVNRMVPFHNAAIQGPRANLRALRRNPMLFVWRGLMLTTMTLLLWWRHKDDEWYKTLNYRDRFLHWYFPVTIGGREELVRIPRAFEVGMIFAALPEMLMDAWYRAEPEQVAEWFRTLDEVARPEITPVLLRVAKEQWQNRQWPDRPIVPMSMQRKPAEEQFNEYTSRAAIVLGQAFNVSPMRVEHAIRGAAGPVAGDLLTVLGMGPSGREKESEPSDALLIGRLFQRGGTLGVEPKPIRDLYDAVEASQLRQHSDRDPEVPQGRKDSPDRQRRLQLEDAAEAVSNLLLARRYAPQVDQRRTLTAEALRIAEDALATAESGAIRRGRFASQRHRAQMQRERYERSVGAR